MNQYLEAATRAARAAGALVRENFGGSLKVDVEEAHDIKLELDVRAGRHGGHPLRRRAVSTERAQFVTARRGLRLLRLQAVTLVFLA